MLTYTPMEIQDLKLGYATETGKIYKFQTSLAVEQGFTATRFVASLSVEVMQLACG